MDRPVSPRYSRPLEVPDTLPDSACPSSKAQDRARSRFPSISPFLPRVARPALPDPGSPPDLLEGRRTSPLPCEVGH